MALVFFALVTITGALAIKFARGKQPQTTVVLPTIEVAQAVMVTVELDFGPTIPSISNALLQIQRHYEPEDKVGRTFSVLDAYGEPTPSGKLHISMHVSTEKPGIGSLIFSRTGEVLWRSKIVLGSHAEPPPLNQRSLLILVDNGPDKTLTIDGSNNPASILDANLKETGVALNSVWADGTDREFTFIYSACGCPVKAMVRRVGERTVRTKELPVIFPDDPAVVAVISHLMKWE